MARAAGSTVRVFSNLPQDRVIHGEGAVGRLREEVVRLGAKRAFVITGRTLAHKTPVVDDAVSDLGGLCAGVFSECREHVPQESVFAAAQEAREAQADLVVSMGGGTPMDTAKAVALILGEGIEAGDRDGLRSHRVRYEYGSGMKESAVRPEELIPHITVPTTISGGDCSHGFSITDEQAGAKDIYIHPVFVPRVVILDPVITTYTPEWLWLSTGYRSVDHAVESYCSANHHPLTDSLALSAFSRLYQHLPRCKERPEDLSARLECQLASWLSIYLVIPNVRFGLSHGLGHQVGARFGVPHGTTSCIFLPPVLEFNAPANAERQAVLAEAIGVKAPGMSPEQAAAVLQDALRGLADRLELPRRLRDFDVSREELEKAAPEIAEHVLGDAVVESNPRRVESAEDVMGIIETAW